MSNPVSSHSFNDDALGNTLDRIHQKGTLKLFTEVALKAQAESDYLLIGNPPEALETGKLATLIGKDRRQKMSRPTRLDACVEHLISLIPQIPQLPVTGANTRGSRDSPPVACLAVRSEELGESWSSVPEGDF